MSQKFKIWFALIVTGVPVLIFLVGYMGQSNAELAFVIFSLAAATMVGFIIYWLRWIWIFVIVAYVVLGLLLESFIAPLVLSAVTFIFSKICHIPLGSGSYTSPTEGEKPYGYRDEGWAGSGKGRDAFGNAYSKDIWGNYNRDYTR